MNNWYMPFFIIEILFFLIISSAASFYIRLIKEETAIREENETKISKF